ncbi:MAG: Response regulator consisting of a CheY-like receiver domain and a DNA-binding domain [Bryobacterales bacterium]|nr:Response regulator consisting of a CheY-like receiver domain and a DNA-binding domain [Bryobacterales bacterium]
MLEMIRQVRTGRKFVPQEIAVGLAEHFSADNLSERELEVLRHLAEGDRNREIGKKLFIAEETVKVHLRHIMSKLGAPKPLILQRFPHACCCPIRRRSRDARDHTSSVIENNGRGGAI